MTTPDSTPDSAAASTSGLPLHARLAEIVEFLARVREEVFTYVRSLPEQTFTQRAGPGQWTVAETMEHLTLIEDGLGRLISNLVKQARADGGALETETTSILGCLDRFNLEDNTLKLKAPEMVQPKGAQSVADSMERMTTSRTRLVQAIQNANGLDLSKVAAPHPFLGPITGYEWLVLIAKHELRHLRQMKNTVRDLDALPS